MHDRAVPVSRDMGCTPLLIRMTPAHSAHLVCLHSPIGETIEVLSHSLCFCLGYQIYERIAQASVRLKVSGDVQKGILFCKAFGIQQIRQHVASILIWQIPQHHCSERLRDLGTWRSASCTADGIHRIGGRLNTVCKAQGFTRTCARSWYAGRRVGRRGSQSGGLICHSLVGHRHLHGHEPRHYTGNGKHGNTHRRFCSLLCVLRPTLQ